ncbi:MAG: hypothetical protein LBM96_08075 [Methanobrevibacter sp.]|jgi:hypothetical protein|nr:hypothetical protein [Candidatus Methanoflexus mossambicus]
MIKTYEEYLKKNAEVYAEGMTMRDILKIDEEQEEFRKKILSYLEKFTWKAKGKMLNT